MAASFLSFSLANYYRAISFVFLAAVELKGLGALSDTLVYHRRYDKYAVMSEKRLLLTGAKAEVDAYFDRWCKTAVNRVCEAFTLVKEAEMKKFGEKSYFYHKANDLPPADSDDNPDTAEDDVDDVYAHGFKEPEEEVGVMEGKKMNVKL